MKCLLLILGLFLAQRASFAQDCQQVEVATSTQQRALLTEYIQECYKKHFFFEDKAVVQLVSYHNPAGQACWRLSALVDDRYQASPPAQYARLGNNILLVYQGSNDGSALPIIGNLTSRRSCIEEVVGGRVYEYAPKPSYTSSTGTPGSSEKVRVTYLSGGNTHNDLIIVFHKDGTISKLIPV